MRSNKFLAWILIICMFFSIISSSMNMSYADEGPQDNEKPVIEVEGLIDNQQVTVEEIEFSVSVTDNVDVSIIPTVELNNSSLVGDVVTGAGITGTAINYRGTLKSGNNSVIIKAVDATGNIAEKIYNVILKSDNNIPVLKNASNTTTSTKTTDSSYSLNLKYIFKDVDNDSLTYKVSVNGGPYLKAETSYKYSNDVAGVYTLVFIANDGKDDSVDTYTVKLTMNPQYPSITTNLSTAEVDYTVGSMASELYVVANIVDSGVLSYQWYKSENYSDLISSVPDDIYKIDNENTANYTPDTSSISTTYYKVVATNTNNGKIASKSSNISMIVVYDTQKAGSPIFTKDLSVNEVQYTAGNKAKELKVEARTLNGDLTYQWYSSTDKVEFTEISGANSSSYRPEINNEGTKYYKVKVTSTFNSNSAVSESSIATITVNEAIGSVYVTVENNTFTTEVDGSFPAWTGKLIDNEKIYIDNSSTMMGSVVAALEKYGHTQTGAESNYISSINGLGEFNGGWMSGWMGTLNDWFTNRGFGEFTVENGNFEDGDEVHIMYTCSYGADLGGSWDNNETTLNDISVRAGAKESIYTLSPEFNKDTHEYSVSIPVTTNSLFVKPTATNKNYQVRTYLNEYNSTSVGYKRSEAIPVENGSEIIIGVGDPAWPGMNSSTQATKYTVTIEFEKPEIKVDLTAYNVAISAVKEADYTSSSWEIYQTVVNANAVTEENTQTEVDAATQAIISAQDSLVKLVDENLEEAKTNASIKKESNYTIESWETLTLALAMPEGTDEEKNAKTIAINNAISELVKKTNTPSQQLQKNLAYIFENLDNPTFGTGGGEWSILSLARGNYNVPKGYYEIYYNNVVNEVKELMPKDGSKPEGRLDKNKGTEHSRLMLGLTSIGKDITNVGGYDIRKALSDNAYVTRQGINGPIFALIAFDTNNYEIPVLEGDGTQTTRQIWIDYILEKEITDKDGNVGGWALWGTTPDPDITAMAIQSLTPYYSKQDNVKAAIDRAITWLSTAQKEDGGYASWGSVNSESNSQVIVALTGLGIDPHTDSRFVKNGHSVIDSLMEFAAVDGGFMHIKPGSTGNGGASAGVIDGMATDQGTYALVAYDRFVNGKNSLYNMKPEKAIDTTAPVITSNLIDKTVNEGDFTFTVSALDEVDGIVAPIVKLGEEVISGVDNSYTVTLKLGENIITVTAEDNSKNIEEQVYTITYTVINTNTPKIQLENNLEYILNNLDNPTFGTGGGEWSILSLARGNYNVPKGYYEIYYNNVVNEVKELMPKDGSKPEGRLDKNKGTEHSRLMLGLTSIGKDITNVGGYDIRKALSDNAYVTRQGINGPIFALIAFDTNNYEIPVLEGDGTQTTRQIWIDYILEKEITDKDGNVGGWALWGTTPDPDITAMAIQSLTPYYSKQDNVKAAIDRAITWLSTAQKEDGGYASWGSVNSESNAQVIVALTGLGIDPHTDSRFVKNGHSVIDSLMEFAVVDGGFMHIKPGSTGNGGASAGVIDGMATDQGTYALVAYDRFVNGKNSLYNMVDVEKEISLPNEDKLNVEVPNDDSDYMIPITEEDSSKEISVQIPEDKSAKVLVELPLNASLPRIEATKGKITAIIPKGIKITGGDSSSLELIKIKDRNDVELKNKISDVISSGKNLDEIVQVFSMGNDNRVEFSDYVVLTFKGMAGKDAAYIQGGMLYTIQKYTSDIEGKNSGKKEYAYDNDNDLVVNTKHFTDFIAYTTTDKVTPGEGSGGGNTTTKLYVTLSIDKKTIDKGYVLSPTKVEFTSGESVWDVLKREMDSNNIDYDYVWTEKYNSVYVESIAGDGEFDHGSGSGWMYNVNEIYPNYGASVYKLKDGDVVQWRYTTNLGVDLGQDITQWDRPTISVEGIKNNQEINEKIITFKIKAKDINGKSIVPIVKINSKTITGTDGEYKVTLKDGENKIEIMAIDKDGNRADATYTIKYISSAAVTPGTVDNNSNVLIEELTNIYLDVDSISSWALDSINRATQRGILSGSNGSFKPKNNVTRAEFVKMITSILGLDINSNKSINFEDVNDNDWFYSYVNAAYNAGIIKGDGSKFNPNDSITREQMASMIVRALNLEDLESTITINDINMVSNWAKSDVEIVVSLGLMTGYNGNFDPSSLATREMSAVVAIRACDYIIEKNALDSESK